MIDTNYEWKLILVIPVNRQTHLCKVEEPLKISIFGHFNPPLKRSISTWHLWKTFREIKFNCELESEFKDGVEINSEDQYFSTKGFRFYLFF